MLRFGLQKTTLIDFPGEVACTIFIAGCNLRCPYCHNPELVIDIQPSSLLLREEVLIFLRQRQGLLGGVCISGGEPLIHHDLPALIEEIRDLGFKIKIDTNGCYPEHLAKLDVDYIAMDIKTLPENYDHLHPQKHDLSEKIYQSIQYIIDSGIPHEFRTTLVPTFISLKDVPRMASIIQGSDKLVLTSFDPENAMDRSYRLIEPYSDEEMAVFLQEFNNCGIQCFLRKSDLSLSLS